MTESNRYPIPEETFRFEIEEQRSRFITTVEPVATPEEARNFVARIKAEFPDASHNCWAYLIGLPGSTARIGQSDDGEPHGTAGRPMLTALLHSGIGDIAVVVSRYFGGIKLGKGGMVRTYTRAVQETLDALPVKERVEKASVQVTLAYSHIDTFNRVIPDYEVTVEQEDYAVEVTYLLSLPEDRFEAFALALREATAGQVRVEVLE